MSPTQEVVHGAVEIAERGLAEIQCAWTAEAVEGDCRAYRARSDRAVEPQDGPRRVGDMIRGAGGAQVRRLGEFQRAADCGDSAGAFEVGGAGGAGGDGAEAGQAGAGADRQPCGVGERAAVQLDRAVGDALGGADRQRAAIADFQRLVGVGDADRCIRRCGIVELQIGAWQVRSPRRGRRRTSRSGRACRPKR